ncbi:hypothetical protein [Legionella bononiensis]|uniref:Uncharacterized protein n=1 Tax=Legionella bononiensis TaxID=2793102 RepID=A0ABS1WFS9_9GAMM|nr:hypothetical protein [Legionella bononiensis]MBL7528206.1 hypothetical protein [Legionella bononiensis]
MNQRFRAEESWHLSTVLVNSDVMRAKKYVIPAKAGIHVSNLHLIVFA